MKTKMLSNRELSMFCDHMAMILKAGLTPAAGIELMLNDVDTEEGRAILLPIATKCTEGDSFSEAIAASGVFPPYACHMIEIGNTSGKLEEVFESLAFHYNREESIAESIKSAVTYPFMIVAMMIIVIFVLVIKVLPIFNKVFNQLGSELSGFSGGLLKLGTTLTRYSVLFIVIFAVLTVAFLIFTKLPAGKRAFKHFCSKFFLTKRFYEKIASGRFASGMAITMAAGLDTDESLDLVEKLVDNDIIGAKIAMCRSLMEGTETEAPQSFSTALANSGIFTSTYSKMVSIGFSTGSADTVLKKIADSYDADIERSMNHTISTLEPTLVIILSVIVCFILLSVIMPLLGIMSGIS
ncbi:MAG: type II secretion system F family protein [Eubacteriales bacterium]|nr:type II secretion system F family protein [Eubacteriales bacterium]